MVTEGATTDVAVTGDNVGTISGKLRGLLKIFTSVWDSVNGKLKVDASGTTLTASGTVTANQGTPNSLANAWPVTSTTANITTRFDYGTRLDGNPVYSGTAALGASDTDPASTAWIVKLFAYDSTNRATSIKVALNAAWVSRATLTYT
jgi:hypothetical protein